MNPSLDPTSPYFLHPGESPGTPLISTILGTNNYHLWERAMWRALRSKNKVKFIDGSTEKPKSSDSLFEAWERCNTYVISWISLSLSSEIAQSVLWIDSAVELWKELQHRYQQGDIFRIAELEEELFAVKQGDLSITGYYTKLKRIWEELDNYRPIPQCSHCRGRCNCEYSVVRGYKEDSCVVRLLRGLNEQFSTARSQLMMTKPLPGIDEAFSLLLQQERQLNAGEMVEDRILMANSGGFRGRGRGRSGIGRGNPGRGGRNSRYCTFCGKSGHLVDVCYRKHGFPPHLKNGGNGNAINNVIADENSDEISNEIQKDSEANSKFDFNSEQREAPSVCLNQQDAQPRHSINQIYTTTLPSNEGISYIMSLSVFSPGSWVIDSGATNHVAFSTKSFQTLEEIKSVLINMPDGSHTIAKLAGKVMFSEQFFLNHVFFIPNFKFNLIAVSKLTKDLKCKLVFDEDNCEIQDKATTKIIGVAEQRMGLYAFESLIPVPATHNNIAHASALTTHISQPSQTAESTLQCTSTNTSTLRH
ncbi:uncharacterized protein LOC127740490 [Arachis duranensis]|uniref:Uncharacterized protein LOC127740490 n=1 Tax=Arachis duranensis TaxID=130453 RepID=A0A9C6WA22_ARADU|nr:uncharacterized protein LOC127740490 [Arachis duranensis]